MAAAALPSPPATPLPSPLRRLSPLPPRRLSPLLPRLFPLLPRWLSPLSRRPPPPPPPPKAAASPEAIPGRRLPRIDSRPPPPPKAAAPHRRAVAVRMASSDGSAPLSTTVAVPGAAGPVRVVAAPSLPEADFRNAVESVLFKQWLRNLQTEKGVLTYGRLNLRQILIQGVDMFGKRVGFLKFKAEIVDEETKTKVPGIVFARGPAVAVLILLESKGQTYAVLTEQVRVPVGKFILELLAGMLDDDKGDFVGTAVREGGCDEEIGLFLYRGHVDEETIKALQGKETGLRDHGELIKLRVVPYSQLWRSTADAKALCAIALYEMAKKEGLLPSPSSPRGSLANL